MKYLTACLLVLISVVSGAQNFPNAEAIGLQPGEVAPNFTGVDQNGNTIELSQLLQEGPVLISFFRGEWCRYCIAQLKDIQDSLSYLSEQNIQVVTVTPALAKGVGKAVQLTKVEFPIISDTGLKIMFAYKVITEENFQNFLKELDAGENNQQKNLPVPAAYLLDQKGKIVYRYFDPNYRERPAVNTVIEAAGK